LVETIFSIPHGVQTHTNFPAFEERHLGCILAFSNEESR